MADITVEELKERKERTEMDLIANIRTYVADFEQATGARVEGVDISLVSINEVGNGQGKTLITDVNLDLDIGKVR